MAGAETAQFVPDRIKQLRIAYGWTRAELADQLGVSRQMVWVWESGGAVPSAQALITLGRLVKIPVEKFFEPLPTDPRPRKARA
jgi:transcriptional regulator with XRE-family HTH domain